MVNSVDMAKLNISVQHTKIVVINILDSCQDKPRNIVNVLI